VPHPDYPITAGVRFLRERKIPFEPRLYDYEEHGGTAVAAGELGVQEHSVIKTLLMQTEDALPLLVLMHGDREVSQKELARSIGVKRVTPCSTADVQRITGYVVGGVSPFGTRSPLPVYVESSILQLPLIFINGGKRGFLVAVEPRYLVMALNPTEVHVAIAEAP